MQFAMLDGERAQAVRGARGSCPTCGGEVIAKCGPRVMHHWAHARHDSCDPWWEKETPWHRAWKEEFPEACREIVQVAPDGEVHRADIKTPSGIVVEVQNSPISEAERISREAFYGNMLWIVNGATFRDRFHVLHHLPDPDCDLAQDLVWFRARYRKDVIDGQSWGMFWRLSENPGQTPGSATMVEAHGIRKIDAEIARLCRGHYQYDWLRPHSGWLASGCPVYLDFGEEVLWRLGQYGSYNLPCIYAVARRKLIYDAMHEQEARSIATRFFPIPADDLI